MKLLKTIILHTLCAPAMLLGYLYVLFFTITFAAGNVRFDTERLVMSAEWRAWVTKFWRYSTTLSYGIIYHPGRRETLDGKPTRTANHEFVHVRQVQDRMWLAFVVGLVIGLINLDFWQFLALWCSGVAWQLPNFLTAVLRGGHIYRDTEHERSAYAQTDSRSDGTSWLEQHLSSPRDW